MEEIKLKTALLSCDKQGFLRVCYNQINEMEQEDAEMHINAVVKLCANKKLPFLIDVRKAQGTYSTEAMRKLAKDKRIVEVRKAQAILVKSLAHRLMANFYIKFFKPSNPVKIFNDEKEAIRWLQQFIPEKIFEN